MIERDIIYEVFAIIFPNEWYIYKKQTPHKCICFIHIIVKQMIKKLFIVRHAQAKEATYGQKDFDRELTPDGLRDALHLGAFFKNELIIPDTILWSIRWDICHLGHLRSDSSAGNQG